MIRIPYPNTSTVNYVDIAAWFWKRHVDIDYEEGWLYIDDKHEELAILFRLTFGL